MRIENKDYILDKIRENIYYYILVDKDLRKEYKVNKEEDKEDYLFIKLEEKIKIIYFNFIRYLEEEYKIKINEINNFKEDIIFFEINYILDNIIEDIIY